MCNGCSLAYTIKSCNKWHWGTVFINREKETWARLKINQELFDNVCVLNIHKSRLDNLNLGEAANQCTNLENIVIYTLEDSH